MRYDLYINGQLADLSEQSLIVLTYTMEQLTNPTAIKNTYSHEVELPQTPNNDKIFNHFYRNDYLTGIANFEALAQIPFIIYNELSEVVERGYIKLNEVGIDNHKHTYKVVLYGGLGQFFYNMAYDESGNALTLGDLQYMAWADQEYRLNFMIGAGAIRSAWERLGGEDTLYNRMWDIINFAPVYQGIPEGEFDAGTAIYLARAEGGSTTADTIESPIYGIEVPKDGYKMMTRTAPLNYQRVCRVDLGEDYNEWQMQELRSYLQRPVLSIRKFMEAVQRRATELGYTLDLDSAFFNDSNPYYRHTWITLPSLSTLTKNSEAAPFQLQGNIVIDTSESQTFSLAYTPPSGSGYEYGTTAKDVTYTLANIRVNVPSISSYTNNPNVLELGTVKSSGYLSNECYIAWFIQLVALDSGNNIVAASNVAVLCDSKTAKTASEIATGASYEAAAEAALVKYNGRFEREGTTNIFRFVNSKDGGNAIQLTIEGGVANASSYELRIDKKVWYSLSASPNVNTLYAYSKNFNWATILTTFTGGEYTDSWGGGTVQANANVRSGARINKRELFDIGKTPLEMLLSYCKLFGLVWLYDKNEKRISLMQRKNFYNGGTTLDISERIDHSKDITITPFEFDKRFYDFELETSGEWCEEYEEKYGEKYGSQRVNTGYPFDADSKNLLEGNALKGGAEVLKQNKQFCTIKEDGLWCPSVFLDGKATYTLVNDNGEEQEFDVKAPTAEAEITYWQDGLQGYDWFSKLELGGDEGGTLLFFSGVQEITENTPYAHLRLTDDIAEMSVLNDGTPCWLLSNEYSSMIGEALPHFRRIYPRYATSLDLGMPKELDNPIPNVTETDSDSYIYNRYWADYLGDRYDKDSRVMTCSVDLRGMQVSNALFRNFYWFDNALWVLNKIKNYSLTTIGSTECEFVKVKDITNYKG